MSRISNQVIEFAGANNLGVYKAFEDYWYHYMFATKGKKLGDFQTTRVVDGKVVDFSLAEKESTLNAAIRKEILRVAGIQDINQFALETWATHPLLKWASFAVVSALIDVILPQTIIDSIGLYTDVRNIGWGDSSVFNFRPRDLFVVSKVGRGKRMTELHKQFEGQQAIIPEPRQIAVSVALYRVLSGQESLGFFVMKCVQSMETEMAYDAYAAFATAMDAIDSTASTGLLVAGYSQSEFVRLSQTVRAWNNNATPLAIGTQAALANILPADANYRYDLDSEYVKLGFIRNFQQTDILMLPQVANWGTPFGLRLADNRIWIVSPGVDKIVKLVLEGSTLAYTDDVYRNANLLQNATIQKSWKAAVATNAVGATIQLP